MEEMAPVLLDPTALDWLPIGVHQKPLPINRAWGVTLWVELTRLLDCTGKLTVPRQHLDKHRPVMDGHKKNLVKLSEESLMKEPEEVFDLLEKIGEGWVISIVVCTYTRSNVCCRAYGAVFKAMHRESGQLLAIKQVPVDADLQDIIKEISIMQQCDRYELVQCI